jgi:hypothetical protein
MNPVLAALPGVFQTLSSGGWESLGISDYDRCLLGAYGLLLGTVVIGRLQADRISRRLTEDDIVYDGRTPKVYWSLSAKELSMKARSWNRLCTSAFLANQLIVVPACYFGFGFTTFGLTLGFRTVLAFLCFFSFLNLANMSRDR